MTMKKNFSQLMAATAIVMASLTSAPAAMAHGAAEPAHGGVVQTASDLSFELVATADGAAIYIVDHDEDADASKFGGKITVLKPEVQLQEGVSTGTVVDLETYNAQLTTDWDAVRSEIDALHDYSKRMFFTHLLRAEAIEKLEPED